MFWLHKPLCIGLHSGTVYMGLVTSHLSQLFIDYMRHTVLAGHLGTNNTNIPVSLILCSQTNLCCTGSFVLPSISHHQCHRKLLAGWPHVSTTAAGLLGRCRACGSLRCLCFYKVSTDVMLLGKRDSSLPSDGRQQFPALTSIYCRRRSSRTVASR